MTTYRTEYESELIGPLTLASDGEAIVGCWFGNDRYFGYSVNVSCFYRPKRGTAIDPASWGR